jgi:hypothetical protein
MVFLMRCKATMDAADNHASRVQPSQPKAGVSVKDRITPTNQFASILNGFGAIAGQ